MKITVSKKELYDKLKMVGKVVGPSKTLPILEHFMFAIENNTLSITGSDSSGMIVAMVKATVEGEEPMQFTVDKTLLTALAELPEQPLEITVNASKNITVNYHNGQFDIPGHDAEAFPILSIPEEAESVYIDRHILIEGIKTVLPFVANDELRPVMNGVYIESLENKLTFVSTDANVLACREYDQEHLPVFGAIIPAKAAKIIQSIILEYTEEKVNVIVNQKNISVKTDKYTVTYRLLEGKYPNYRKVIPSTKTLTTIVDRDEFLSLIKRVSVFSNVSSKLLKLDIGQGAINVSAQDIDYSISASETIFAEVDGIPMVIGFNALRLAEIITAIDVEQCSINLLDPSRAGIVKPEGVSGVTLLIMPMLINS